ncbi:MAG: penicillin-binding transpeptidase domain-containing protein [Clostridia bacterium]|nr:penicillin-binding transpeptidase domain-containing protein [Clostridia bacterium]
MKQQRVRFHLLTLVIVGLLLMSSAYGVYSVTVYGSRWFSSARNTRNQSARRTVVKGDIIDRWGVILASTNRNGDRVYQSDMASRKAVVHLVGDEEGNIANGVDSFQSAYLLGFETSLTERVSSLLKGETRRGDNVTLTVDSALCTDITNAFSASGPAHDKAGAAVVMNYRTGEVLALVSLPVFDPASVNDQVRADPLHPFWNRALQGTLPPGSTFKIITAAAVLQNVADAAAHTFECTGATQVLNRVVTDFGMAKHGKITLERAFTVSCNNAFAQCALLLGDTALRRTAESFGFNDNFLFRDFVVENSHFPTRNRNEFEVAWSGVGQSQVAATPLHMCMVAASIANRGVMMEPRLLGKVQSPAGVVRLRFSPKQYTQVCSQSTASILDGYMKNVVAKGSGTAAGVKGITVAGKTGSAEGAIGGKAVTHAWFAGYIADPALPYACCVMVEGGGNGGTVAAPIAARIFRYLKDHYSR